MAIDLGQYIDISIILQFWLIERRAGGREKKKGGSKAKQEKETGKTWILLTADLSRYKSTRMHFSSNWTPSSKVKFSCHSSRRIGLARWFPSPVDTWLSSKFTPIMLTWIRFANTKTEKHFAGNITVELNKDDRGRHTMPRYFCPFFTPPSTSEFHNGLNLLRLLYITRVK